LTKIAPLCKHKEQSFVDYDKMIFILAFCEDFMLKVLEAGFSFLFFFFFFFFSKCRQGKIVSVNLLGCECHFSEVEMNKPAWQSPALGGRKTVYLRTSI